MQCAWKIEDTFKNSKQYFGCQEPQTFRGKGPERAAGLSLWLYSTVWLWYLMQKNNKRYFIVHPWNPLKSTPSFADAIACLRRELGMYDYSEEPRLAYSDADVLADGATETVVVIIENNGVGALAVCTLNHCE